MDPIIGGLFAKGLSLVANAAVVKGKDWIKEKSGIDLEKEELSEKDYLALREFEFKNEEMLLEYKFKENKLNADVEIAYLNDKANARDLQKAALNQDDLFSKRFLYILALVWSIFSMMFFLIQLFHPTPEANTRTVDGINIFLLGTVIPAILYFFYGTSKSSQNKDGVIKDVVDASLRKQK
jgi:hypothetical protein